MPELPEVEVVRRGLERFVVGRTVSAAEVMHPRAVRRHVPGPGDFAVALVGQRFDDVRRRGKYLWFPLDGGQALLAHLGMSGQLLVRPAEAPDELHLRVRFTFTDGGTELRFVDQRTFGGLVVSQTSAAGIPAEIAHIALDPLDATFDDDVFGRTVRRRHTGVKRALLDQTLISGVGNIYADEALWQARLHYARPTETLTRPELARVLVALREVMGAALSEGGTSFDSLYVDVNGTSGYFDRSLRVYGRAGKPCPRCGTPIRRDRFMNRSSYTCPRCQPRPRRARW
ncbi:MAG TPA: bifunctional DNA-formamidopyrimidine glycosylase/DNA-(apurinic or apyrimidinic site) lyase [Jiangellaceae bacterium]|nr:bifunctional DNA-formamidopyrimidine glycosylase/DNA-(apurinic or apyrimidinic site) lyase [Jiangellaceae bacterium]